MWKDYSYNYVRNNPASSISIVVAAFISALMLSLLCGVFYNLWNYETERLKREEGSWHSRITGELSEEDLNRIQNFSGVEAVIINEEMSDGQKRTADIYFKNMRNVFKDTPQIASLLGCGEDCISYNYALLAMYLIRDAKDEAPRAIFPLLLAVTITACVSLIMIVHNAFTVSMTARIHQLGILSGIGASPGQIRTFLICEALALCALPVTAGNFMGIAVSKILIEGTNSVLDSIQTRTDAVFTYNPLIFACSFLLAFITIFVSALIPAYKMSRLTPLEAIRNTHELQLKKRKSSCILSLLFGIEGELAGNAMKAQKKNLRMAATALLFSFSAFFLMQCFFTLTEISQRMTYFERYQDAWDVMITLKNTDIEEFDDAEALKNLGARSINAYQKASAKTVVTKDMLSGELTAMGSMSNAPKEYVSGGNGEWIVNAPVLILDDDAFLEYCARIGVSLRTDGAVVINRIRDVTNPNFRDVRYFPYLDEKADTVFLLNENQKETGAEIPVIGYTQELPVLRESYAEVDYYELVHVIPVSVWKKVKDNIGGARNETFIRILAEEGADAGRLNEIGENAQKILGGRYETVIENRIQDKIDNDKMIDGMMLVLGGFCVLLALIGIGGVFSNALGFVHQRKREFARYMSVGLTPEGIKKMFCIEALVLVGNPVLISLVLTAVATIVMIKASYLEPIIFIREMPVIPVMSFIAAVFVVVAFAYYLGGRRVMKNSLADTLRDDTML